MLKKTIILVLAAAALLFLPSGATQTTAHRDNTQTQTVSVIPNPPDGWTSKVNISNLPWESSLPMIAVDNNGKAYVCWEEWHGGVGDPRAMAFNTNYTGQWGTAQENFLYYDTIDDVGFPVIACDPSDGTAYLAYHDGDFVNWTMEVMFKEYTRGVKTWEGWISGTPGASDYATLAVDPNSKVVYCVWFDDRTGQDTFELVYKWRNPTTKQWSGLLTIPVFTGRSKYWRDMVIDKNGTAHLAFILRSPAEVWYTKNPTPQNQNTWTAPVPLSGNTDRDWAMPRIAADNDGEVYVVWHANTGGYESATEEVWLRKTVNGVWQAKENLSNSPTRSEGEVVAVDPDTKDVYVVWNELVSGGNWEVYLRMYTTQTAGGAKSWGDIYNMTNNPAHSAEPFLRLDPQRGLHLVFHDYVGANREIMYMYKQGISPPLSVTVDSTLNAAEDQKTNTITWAANPANSSLIITNYKIYRKTAQAADTAFASLNQVTGSTFTYTDANLSAAVRYTYRLTAVTNQGAESGPSFAVTDKPVFAPVGLSLTTSANKILFYEIKDNTITFFKSPNNEDADILEYHVYRRKVNETDSALSRVGTVGTSAFRYTDAQLRGGQKYAYAVKTKFTDNRVSGFSAVVLER